MGANETEDDRNDPHENGGGGDDLNVVFVVMDTARSRETVPADPKITPTLASLAAEGTEFTNAFSSAPWTLPSHASLFTGTYTSAHGAHGGHTRLDESHPTLAEAFSEAGYETVAFSNNSWITEEFGFTRGFDTFRKGWQLVQSGVDTGATVRAEYFREWVEALADRLFEGNPLVTAANALYESHFRSDDGAERTTAWIEQWLADRDEEEPFFLFCNYLEPHIAYDPPREFAEPFLPDGSYEEATRIRQDPRAFDVGDYDISESEFRLLHGLYCGELAYLDSHLGRLRTALQEVGEWENTLFVVLGDHGENVGDYGFFGHQYNLYDTLLHVPLVVRGGPFQAGGRRDELVQLLDVVPTLLDAAGIDAPELRDQAQGRSFHPESTEPPREEVLAEYVAPQPPISNLEERFGHVPNRVRAYDRQLSSIRTKDAKYVRGSDGYERLWLVEEDGSERVDRASERPELVAELSARLDELLDGHERRVVGDDAEAVSMTASTERRLADLGYL